MINIQCVTFPPVTPEELYRQDQRKMKWDEKERRLDRELAAYYERFPEEKNRNPFEQHNTKSSMTIERLIVLLNAFPQKALVNGNLRIRSLRHNLDIRLSDSGWNL